MAQYENLRNFLNDNYGNIIRVLTVAVRNAIQAAEDNGEDEVVIHLVTLIDHVSRNGYTGTVAIDNYLSSVNQNSSTRQFFEIFVAYVQ
jgi:hypothetical protein